MTTNHEHLAKLDASESLTPVDTYNLGLAALTTGQDEPSLSPDEKREFVRASATILISGLRIIRGDPSLSERQKLYSGQQVLANIDFDKLPDPELKNELFGQAMLNISEGLRPQITKRVGKLRKEWHDEMLQLSALLRLGNRVNTLTPEEQLQFLSTDLQTVKALDKEGRKKILVAWAKSRIKQGASEEEVSGVVKFFFDQEDHSSVSEIINCLS